MPDASPNPIPTRPLRFAIMCNSTDFEPWRVSCLTQLLGRQDVELRLLIKNQSTRASGLNLLKRIRWREFLFQIYSRFFVPSPWVDMSDDMKGVAEIHCTVEKKGKFSEYFSPPDIDEIRSYDLDFILRFGFGIIRGDILQTAQYGVWSFHHGDEMKYRGRPAGFWELFRKEPSSGAILQRLTDRLDGGVVLRKGWLRTVEHSYAKQLEHLCGMTADWPNQVCNDIQNGCADYFNDEPTRTDAPVYYAPTNFQMLRFAAKIIARKLGVVVDRLFFHDQWNVGYVDAPIDAFLDPDFKPEVTWLPGTRRGQFVADSFAIRHQDKTYVFVEEFDHRTRRGLISYQELGETSDNAFHPVIDTPTHLSYPFLLKHDGEIYCIPEACATGDIVLYRAQSFPDHWTREATLIEGFPGIDPTVFQFDGRWWLICTRSGGHGGFELHIFHAENLLGPWRPHAGNPVKTDVHSARPAGTPFLKDGSLYRPAQDCSTTYGGRIAINQVSRLTPTEFRESVVGFVEPDPSGPYPDGIHTISGVGSLTVIDGKKIKFVGGAFLSAVHRIAGRLAAPVKRLAPGGNAAIGLNRSKSSGEPA
jgi:hypothetical protein